MPSMTDLLKMARDAQSQIGQMQEELARMTVEAGAGGGMVTVVANGKQQIVSIVIKPEVIDPADPEMLQDLIVAAANEALRKAQEMATAEMSKIAGGFNLPGLGNIYGGGA